MNGSDLTSTQALDYSLACRLCGLSLRKAARSLADIRDPASVPNESQFKSPQANRLYDGLGNVGAELQAARGRLAELISLLHKMDLHYLELYVQLAERELADEARSALTGP